MGTSLTAETVQADNGQLWHKGEHLDVAQVLHRKSDFLLWHEENSVQQTWFPGIILNENLVHRLNHSVLLSKQGDHVHGRGFHSFMGIEEKHLAT